MISRRLLLRKGHAGAEHFVGVFLKSGATALSRLRQSSVQLPHPVEARVDSFSCARRADAFLVDGFENGALGDAHAAADGFAVGHLGNLLPGIFRRRETAGACASAQCPYRCAAIPCSA